MRFASLGSGSRGNGTLVEHLGTLLLVDCGFGLAETEFRMSRLGKKPDELSGILVTHEHSDHLSGVARLANKYQIRIYLTAGTYHQSQISGKMPIELINSHRAFVIGDIEIQPVLVPHDAREPCQYIFKHDEARLGLLTDIGSVTPFVKKHYDGLDALLLECNYDPAMLQAGRYPHKLKQRILGSYGHLSNKQSADLLASLDLGRMQHLVLSHLSQQNNTPELALSEVEKTLGKQCSWLSVSDQETGFPWREIR